MTKTKVEAASPSHSVSAKGKRLNSKMETGSGHESAEALQMETSVQGKKKPHRAPSPARPKDVPGWSITKIRGGIGAPTLSVKPGGIHLGGHPLSRVSRRSPLSGKDTKGEKIGKAPGKSALGAQKTGMKSNKALRRKVSDASIASDEQSKDSGKESGKLSPTDSSSELSDCASEENKVSTDALSSDTESSSRGVGAEEEMRIVRGENRPRKNTVEPLGTDPGEGSVTPGDERSFTSLDSRMPASTSLAFSDLTEEITDGVHEEYIREIEELRSENDYLKDEVEELRSEMLEMRDMYMEEDVYQLQQLRQQFEQANKTCRILQYRLRKAERRSLRVAQTGQVDGEFIRTLEQDVKVAKDVSIRLHNELEAAEKKRSHLELENEEMQVKLQDLEVAKQVLQAELEKSRENSLKKRSVRQNNKTDKKVSTQSPEDSSDLKCQLHFAKEESALMCKKLTKMVKDNEVMKEELAKYRSLYGDVDTSLTVEELADSPHTREAEVRVHLKLVEEEANLLSRRIVELEVENRGLRAEMDDLKIQETPGGMTLAPDIGQLMISPSTENAIEMQRHLQFVEEEAALLRRSLIEMEEQNKLLMNEINRYKSELPPNDNMLSTAILPPSIVSTPSEEEARNETSSEDLVAARLQIDELNSKIKELQYENGILQTNLKASRHVDNRLNMTNAEAGGSADYIPSQECCEGTLGGEVNHQNMVKRVPGNNHSNNHCLNTKEILAIHDQAKLVSSTIQLLVSADSNSQPVLSDFIIHQVKTGEYADIASMEKSQTQGPNPTLVDELYSRLQFLLTQLHALSQSLEILEESFEMEHEEGGKPVPSDNCYADTQVNLITAHQKQFNIRDETDLKKSDTENQELYVCKAEDSSNDDHVIGFTESNSALLQEELQKVLVQQDFRLQSMSLQTRLLQKFWNQERNVLVHESQQLKQCLLFVGLKLRWLLKQWRVGTKIDTEGKDMLEINSIKELQLHLEDDSFTSYQGDKKMLATEDQPLNSASTDHIHPENIPLQQSSGLSVILSDLKMALQDLSTELREEHQSSQELTQQFARAKASWEFERTELQRQICQLEGKSTKSSASCSDVDSPELKGATKRDCEEHQHLLADSYAAVMDLTKQLQISERNWNREKLELLERFSQERSQWEQRLHDAQNKGAQSFHEKEKGISKSATTVGTTLQSNLLAPKSDLGNLLDTASFLSVHEVSRIAKGKSGKHQFSNLVTSLDMSDFNQKNWKYLNSELASMEKPEPFKTWDCPSTSFHEPEMNMEHKQRSYTAPDKTGIRIYYSPPAIRRMERMLAKEPNSKETMQGLKSQSAPVSEHPELAFAASSSSLPSLSSYRQWLSSLSQQHRDLLEGKSGSTASFPTLEISANLSDDMKEMTNCVRQAIRSSSLERKCNKDTASQTVGFTSTGVQTTQYVSVGLQTDSPLSSSSRATGLYGKVWSPRPSTSVTSARSRQISSSLEKVHGRIDRPCCSPKYGSPKLTRRISTSSSSSKLETSSTSSRDRSVWNLPNRAVAQNGSAWARSTTTRDSPVLSGLNDGLSSLFSVVEHTSSMESLWRGDTFPARHAARKPSCPSVNTSFSESGPQKYGIVQEFFQNVCGRTRPGEKAGPVDDPKTECLTNSLISPDGATKIINKSCMRQTQRDELVGSVKESSTSSLEDTLCECATQAFTSPGFVRSSRSTVRHSQCKHHLQEPVSANEDRLDASNE